MAPDLSLVPIDDLVKEIESRSESCVCAYKVLGNSDPMDLKFHYGIGKWLDAVALASILKNDVINNWNGELRYLEKKKMEEDDGIQ